MFTGIIKADEIKGFSEENEILKFPLDGVSTSAQLPQTTILSIEFSNGEFIKVKYNIKGYSETRKLVDYLHDVISEALIKKV